MTIQWMLVASFLYFELGLIAVLILPFISPKIWRSIFHFHLWKVIAKKANMYFSVLIFILILFFLDSIRDMKKYSAKHDFIEMDANLQMNVKLFRSQRNYYISGFAVFLWLVIRRLVVLIIDEADLLERNEEAGKEAQEATEHLQRLTKSKKEGELSAKLKPCHKAIDEIRNLEESLNAKKSELTSIKQRMSNLKEKDDQIQSEYGILLKKHNGLTSTAEA